MNVTLREFSLDDVTLKVRWINDPRNNRFLHYDLPLEEKATAEWYQRVKDLSTRRDMTILCDGIPVGIAGLLQIDQKNKSAELYVTVGEESYKGKNIAGRSMIELLQIAFGELGLQRVYLLTEVENIPAVRAYEKFGFVREGCLRNELIRSDGTVASRYVYSILKEEYDEKYGNAAHLSNSISGK